MSFLSSFYPQPVVPNAIEVTATGSDTARTLSDRFAERVNILDFDADPTGVTSSRTALINAIAAAPSGGVVYIPRGTYSGIYEININKPISIIGDGQLSSVIDTPPLGNRVFSIVAGCTYFGLMDLTLQYEYGWMGNLWPNVNLNITGDASTNTITAIGHQFINGQYVKFSSLSGGSGLTSSTKAYVVRDASTNTFKVYDPLVNQNAVDFTTNITSGTVSPLGRSEGIRAMFDAPSSLETHLINVKFKNLAESIALWYTKTTRLHVEGCVFTYKHGYAGCRTVNPNPTQNWWETDIGFSGWPIVGNARYVDVFNNEFNGCEDFTFTGVPESTPAWVKTPIDNFYKGGGLPYDVCCIRNNIIKNFGVEGVLIERFPVIGSWLNPNDGWNLAQATVSGNTFIGPQKVSTFSRGVNPAISIYRPHKLSVIGNHISNCWTGIVTHGIQMNTVTANASDNKFTITYGGSSPFYPTISNGASIRFIYKGNGATSGDGIDVDKQYFVINAETLDTVNKTQKFKLSESLNGSEVDLTTNMTGGNIVGEEEWQNQQVLIDSNIITGCISGIASVDSSYRHVHATNNYICVESEPCKTSQGWWSEDTTQDPPPNAANIIPIYCARGGMTVERNVAQFGKTEWDGIFDLVSRSGASNNVMTLGSGQAAQLAALRQTADSVSGSGVGSPIVYNGLFTVWNENGVYRWPIDSIDTINNTVTITAGWATNNGADTFTSGKIYWSAVPSVCWHAFIEYADPRYGTLVSKDNIAIDAVQDIVWSNTRPTAINSFDDTFRNLRGGLQKYQQHITRKNELYLLNVLQGTGAPSATAPNGSLYLRTDGDASTTMYVRAGNAWKPLSSWNP